MYAVIDEEAVWGIGPTPEAARQDAAEYLRGAPSTWPVVTKLTHDDQAIKNLRRSEEAIIIPCSEALAHQVREYGEPDHTILNGVAVTWIEKHLGGA